MGVVTAIYIADRAGGPMRPVETAEFVAGRGIVGDRYFAGTGTWSPQVRAAKNEVTLVDLEQVRWFNETSGLVLRPEQLRRNLVTRDVDLNALVGVRFAVAEVVLEGIRLCEPCQHLAGATAPEVLTALVHRAGLRAGIIRGGIVNLREAVPIRRLD